MEENAALNVEERDSMDSVGGGDAAMEVVPPEPYSVVGEEERTALIVKDGDSAAEGSDIPLSGGQANFSGLVCDNDSISGNKLEENKEESLEEETQSHDHLVSEVNGVDCIKSDDKREEGEQVVSGGMAEEEREGELGNNTESEKEKLNVMEDVTTAQAAPLVSDIEIPDDNEVASLAEFTEIPSQDKGLDDSVLNTKSEFVEEEPLEELQISEGAKALTDRDAKEDADVTEDAMGIQVSKKTEEEGKTYGAAVLETETKPQEVADVATEVSEKNVAPVDISSAVITHFAGETRKDKESVMDDVKKDTEQDPEAGKFVDIQVPEAAEEVVTDVKNGAGIEKVGDEMGKVDGTKIAEVSEETETRIEDEDQAKDDDMTDVAEDVTTHGDSPIADIEERRENHEEMEMTKLMETQEEGVMTETGNEEPEEVEEENKSTGGKRKRVKNTKTAKGIGKKKEEDVCFMCFDGGDLVLCDRRGCPKAYHTSCVNRDEAFFQSKGKWNCGWHLCRKCKKTATYLCYTCKFSLCKGCAKDAVFFCIRGNKGLCETCMETVKLIERKEHEKELTQLDFDDKTSWEYLFKDYWIDLKTQLSLSPEELDQAKSPWKGHESNASKQGAASETDYITDGGSDSNCSLKKRKTRSRSKSGSAEKIVSPAEKNSSGESLEWASKELLDVVAHMRRGDRSVLPQSDAHNLLLDYIKRYNLRDRRRKSQVICDSRLQNLFGKSHVGHFEMLNLLESHFLKKGQNQADDIHGDIADTEEPNHVDVDENLDHPVKSGKDKKHKTRKKGGRKGRQSNLDDFAAIDMHNINLIYLRRSLVEDLLDDSTAFEGKVANAFVRLRISGNQKQDLYRLVQVVGTSTAPETYKVGKKTTDFVLEILNLDTAEVISIDIISNQDFTEDECKRLKQSIKCGLINRLTVGDIQEKAIALQEVRVKNLLEAEILCFTRLRDRASDMGRRKELRECVEKLQLLKSPEERSRRLEKIPEIHADPKMDPDCESEDEDEKEKHLRPRSSSFNRRGNMVKGKNEGQKNYEPKDQQLITRNLTLKNSIHKNNHVRVIRCKRDPSKSAVDAKKYVYDGLYRFEEYSEETGSHGKCVFKLKVQRIPGQSELSWKLVKESKRSEFEDDVCNVDISEGKETLPICAVNKIDTEKPPPFIYTAKMIYPDWCRPIPPRSCGCVKRCSESKNCGCVTKNGGELPYNHKGALVKAKPFVYECGPLCSCPPSCYMRVAQHGIKAQLEIFKTESRGWGVRSLKSIPSGSFICEYVGELMEDKEAERLSGKDEYLFDIGAEKDAFTIDAARKGNIGRFINHSCSPNLFAQDVLYDHEETRIPHVMFFAMENIPPLEELTYDYNYKIDQVHDSNGNIKKKDCYCGSKDCTGRLY